VCPGSHAIGASTCTGTAFDTIIYLKASTASAADLACSDDETGCGNGLQSRFTGATLTGPGLGIVIVDGFGQTGNGAYTLTYTIN